MTRAEKYEHIITLRDLYGCSGKRIAELMGCSVKTVYAIINDPDGSKQKTRRERYRGTCVDCGAKTDGSSGYNAPKRCDACTRHHTKIWTQEAVIGAIQKWARLHGKPPASREWMHSDTDGSYPAATSVYGPQAAFPKWADAIEAAGFHRPKAGVYGDRQEWSREKIIGAIVAWTIYHGRPPVMPDWKNVGDENPSSSSVRYYFGSWSNAIETAGFPRPTTGTRRAA